MPPLKSVAVAPIKRGGGRKQPSPTVATDDEEVQISTAPPRQARRVAAQPTHRYRVGEHLRMIGGGYSVQRASAGCKIVSSSPMRAAAPCSIACAATPRRSSASSPRPISAGLDTGPPAPLRPHHGLVQCLEEGAAVLRRVRGIDPAALARLAPVLVQLAHRQRHADRIGRERPAGRPEHHRALGQRPSRQRNIGRDDDIAGPACSTIQSSATSAPCGTITWTIIGSRDGRNPRLATKVTTIPCRAATRRTSSLTGQASASTRICGALIRASTMSDASLQPN